MKKNYITIIDKFDSWQPKSEPIPPPLQYYDKASAIFFQPETKYLIFKPYL